MGLKISKLPSDWKSGATQTKPAYAGYKRYESPQADYPSGRLTPTFADVAFGKFRRQLEYKCQWYGAKLVIVNRFFPSS
jgi:hypothetical protein